MVTRNTYRILIWVIVILAATTFSMGISFWYHKQQDKKAAEVQQQEIEMPSEQRTRFFREQLDLNANQIDVFRELNRNYNRSARWLSMDLEELRLEMVKEMGQATPDKEKLDKITQEIGSLHTELKQVTIRYYLDMKAECNEKQKQKLNEIFISVSKSKEDISLPKRGGPRRGNNQNK